MPSAPSPPSSSADSSAAAAEPEWLAELEEVEERVMRLEVLVAVGAADSDDAASVVVGSAEALASSSVVVDGAASLADSDSEADVDSAPESDALLASPKTGAGVPPSIVPVPQAMPSVVSVGSVVSPEADAMVKRVVHCVSLSSICADLNW